MAVNVPSESPQEDPKHVEEMVAKAEALQNGESPMAPTSTPSKESNAERPEGLPEKFSSVEDLVKSYQELEKKLGSPHQEETKGDEPQETLEISTEEATEALEEQGIDMAALRTEYDQNQELSEETYAKLDKAGFNRTEVDNYIAGQQALAAQVRQAGYDLVGGQDEYTAMAEWAKENMTPEERTAYNESLANPATREVSIRGLHAKYVAAVGQEPGRRVGGNTNTPSVDAYDSRAQLVAAMSDPRYKTDPAYIKEVQAKLARSDIF